MKWSEALRMYNAGKTQWCMPRRGSPEHAAVLKLMGRVPKGEVSKPAATPRTEKPSVKIPSMYDEPGSDQGAVRHRQHVPKVQTAAERGMALSKARDARHRKAENPHDNVGLVKSFVESQPEEKRREFLEGMARANGVPVRASDSMSRIMKNIGRTRGAGGISAYGKHGV